MKNRTGVSWGPEAPINVLRTSRGWILVDFSGRRPRIVVIISKRLGVLAKSKALDLAADLNYGSALIDAETRAAIDATP